MNEFELRDELREKRENIKTIDDLVEFLKYVKDNCNCGYGETPRAIAQAAVATARYFAGEFGITGYQAGFVMFDFLRDWEFRHNKCGLKIIDFDDMLYPQYEHRYDKTIPDWSWEAMQKAAKEELETDHPGSIHPAVKAHWQSIVDGKVPFGYTVK